MQKSNLTWKGVCYPVREVNLPESWGYTNPVAVAEENLWNSIEEDYYNGNKEAEKIDNEIFFYCEVGFLKGDPTDKEIINYLKENGI